MFVYIENNQKIVMLYLIYFIARSPLILVFLISASAS